MPPAARFSSLDGLRGLAAMAVMAYHVDHDWMPGGHLAVDFFFCLSGFVIALNYQNRMRDGAIGVVRFMALRLARLYPMVLAGALLAIWLLHADYRILALVPSAWGAALFPGNPPYWSLLAELVVSLAFAVLLVRLDWRWLLAVCVLAGAGLVGAALAEPNGDSLGLMEVGAFKRNAWAGPVRALYSFTLGMLLFEVWRRWPTQRPVRRTALLIPLALLAVMCAWPGQRLWWDLVAAMVLLPALALAAIRWEMPGARLNGLLGDVSYPLYCIHVPVTFALRDEPQWQIAAAAAALIPAALLLDRLVDRPARQWLAKLARRVGA
jgi:peptidoglycan/LPS O-acetylase OafA/YrhL